MKHYILLIRNGILNKLSDLMSSSPNDIISYIIMISYFLFVLIKEKREKILLSPMTKAHTPTEMSKGQNNNTNNATKSFITQRLRTDLGRSATVIVNIQ